MLSHWSIPWFSCRKPHRNPSRRTPPTPTSHQSKTKVFAAALPPPSSSCETPGSTGWSSRSTAPSPIAEDGYATTRDGNGGPGTVFRVTGIDGDTATLLPVDERFRPIDAEALNSRPPHWFPS